MHPLSPPKENKQKDHKTLSWPKLDSVIMFICFWDRYDEHIYGAFNKMFACLPIAALVQNETWVVHGGLYSRNTELHEIRSLDRLYENPPEGISHDSNNPM